MTPTQQQTYNAIKQHHYIYGVTPTYAELMRTLGKTLATIRKSISHLENHGLITIFRGRKRGIYLK